MKNMGKESLVACWAPSSLNKSKSSQEAMQQCRKFPVDEQENEKKTVEISLMRQCKQNYSGFAKVTGHVMRTHLS
jgi:hypothetical protein